MSALYNPLPPAAGEYEPNWIDYRASLRRVIDHQDAGEPVDTCTGCGCEIHVVPVPHSPRCHAHGVKVA